MLSYEKWPWKKNEQAITHYSYRNSKNILIAVILAIE